MTPRRKSWRRRLLDELLVILISLCLLAGGLLVLADSDPGHRYIADRLASTQMSNGLRIKVGRIDGSIFGEAVLKNVELIDTKGVFATSPEITLDWAPGAWLYRKVHIERLESPLVNLLRKPAFRPSVEDKPLIPDFDIYIGKLAIERIEFAKEVTGTPRVGALAGRVDVRAGRAMLLADFKVADGDELKIDLDAEPDADRFNVDAVLQAPADGVIPALLGLRKTLDLRIKGAGGWKAWEGSAKGEAGGVNILDASLTGRNGQFRLNGRADPARIVGGALSRLTAGGVTLRGEASLKDGLVDGELRARARALRLVARGGIHSRDRRYQDLRVGIDLLDPAALNRQLGGKGLRLALTLDGKMGAADYGYRLSSPAFLYGKATLLDLVAEGRGQSGPWPMRVPVRAKARAVSGLGEVAGGILNQPRLLGFLNVSPDFVRGDDLRLESAKLRALIDLFIDTKSGRFDVAMEGGLARYEIPSIGMVDVTTKLRLVPGADGKARLTGTGEAKVRRLDNGFFASLTGGLPTITSQISRGPDGILRLSNLRLVAPKLTLTGSGMRRLDGTYRIEASGRQASYGPLKMTLDGRLNRPKVDLFLDNPNKALDVRDVKLTLDPTAQGFAMTGAGQSRGGPFTLDGAVLLPPGEAAIIRIDKLAIAGSVGTGRLEAVPGGLLGTLALSGGGIEGELAFRPQGQAQRIEMDLRLANAFLPGEPPIRIGRGTLRGVVILADAGVSMDASLRSSLASIGAVDLGKLNAEVKLQNGEGVVTAKLVGSSARALDLDLVARLQGETIILTGDGVVEREAVSLATPARLTRKGEGWALQPVTIRYGRGSATLSGETGREARLDASLSRLPLDLLDLFVPDAGFSGEASGEVHFDGRGRDKARIDLKVRDFSRAGLVLSSRPIDLGVAAKVEDGKAAIRAVAASDGRTVGRMQARFSPLASGQLIPALLDAPMQMQLRYAGPADTLWRLSGVELFDLTGPVSIGADVGGRLSRPVIRGSVKSDGARIESAVTGMVLENVKAEGRFDGSRLNLSRVSGTTPGGGSIAGGGSVTFGGGALALDLKFDAKRAELLARDDISATVSGPLRIRSDESGGGTLTGDLRLDAGTFALGRAAAAAAVPKLDVREINVDPATLIKVEQLSPWKLDFKVAGGSLDVSGLGIESQWRTDLEIKGRVDAPRLYGTASLVRGTYDFAGRNFRLDRGLLRFRGASPPDPLLDIRAEAEVQGINASVLVQGTGLNPQISFTSVPALPQEELLSRILFGTSITNLSPAEALQLGAAVASLRDGGGGLDPINAVRRAVGLDRLRIVPANIATGQKTGVAAGKYITRKLFVEVITDGQGYSATQIEYQITRWLSLLSSVSTIGRTSANVRVSKDY